MPFSRNHRWRNQRKPIASNYLCVQDEESLAKLLSHLATAERLAFDVETTSQDAVRAELVGLGIGWAPGQAAYIPVAHSEGNQLAWPAVVERLRPFFLNPALPKAAHNGKYDLTVLRRHGLEVAGAIDDTLLIAWLLDPGSRSLGLKALAAEFLGWQMTELTDLIGTGRKQITMDQAPIAQAAAYCGADVDATLHLYDLLAPRLQAAELWRTLHRHRTPPLACADRHGDGRRAAGHSLPGGHVRHLHQPACRLEDDLYAVVGHPFNVRSTQQLSQVLFEELKFPTRGLKKTASGHFSTAVDVLESLAASVRS